MATLFLIRHCEPEVRGTLLGQIDCPLSTQGEKHASSAFSEMDEVPVTWCSPLRRAVQTAAHVRSKQRTILPGLREIDHGEWAGKTWAEIEVGWPELAKQKLEKWNDVDAPSGETWATFIARVHEALKVMSNGARPAAVVAHQGVNAAITNLLSGADPLQFVQRYGEIIRVEYD